MRTCTTIIPMMLFVLTVFLSCKNEVNEVVFFNGKIFTADTTNLFVEAVAVKGDKIIAVGTKEEVLHKVGKHADMIDLGGKCLLPGFIDTHIHVLGGGQTMISAHMKDEFYSYDSLKKFADQSYQNQNAVYGKYIMITGLNQNYFERPDSLSLVFNSGVYKSQPVFLRSAYGHTGWINNTLSTELRIDKKFIPELSLKDRAFYDVARDGTFTGIMNENPVFDIFSMIQNRADKKNVQAAIAGIKYCNSLGITAMLDPRYQDPSPYYKVAADSGLLTAHMAVCIRVDPDKDPEKEIHYVDSLRKVYSVTPNLDILGIKVFADGVAEYPSQTAALSKPYTNSGQAGNLLFDTEKFSEFVLAADRAGLAVHVHSIGDRAITETLNGFELAKKRYGNKKVNHTIAHLQFVNPSDFKRFDDLGVMASFQFYWAIADTSYTNLIKPYIDPGIYYWQYPANSMRKEHVTIVAGSDWPVTTPDPFAAMFTGETRRGETDLVLNENEKMPRLDLLYAFTRDAAKALNMENSIGTIEVGKLADFVLVDRDVTSVSSDELKNTKVIWTMLGGKKIYEADRK